MRADIWCDGAAKKKPNPGPAGAGFVVIVQGRQPQARSIPLGPKTNNEAEYEAVIRALRLAASQGATRAYVRTDSPVVVGQYRKPETCDAPHLRELLGKLNRQVARFPDGVTISRVSRERNSVADRLAQNARDAKA